MAEKPIIIYGRPSEAAILHKAALEEGFEFQRESDFYFGGRFIDDIIRKIGNDAQVMTVDTMFEAMDIVDDKVDRIAGIITYNNMLYTEQQLCDYRACADALNDLIELDFNGNPKSYVPDGSIFFKLNCNQGVIEFNPGIVMDSYVKEQGYEIPITYIVQGWDDSNMDSIGEFQSRLFVFNTDDGEIKYDLGADRNKIVSMVLESLYEKAP